MDYSNYSRQRQRAQAHRDQSQQQNSVPMTMTQDIHIQPSVSTSLALPHHLQLQPVHHPSLHVHLQQQQQAQQHQRPPHHVPYLPPSASYQDLVVPLSMRGAMPGGVGQQSPPSFGGFSTPHLGEQEAPPPPQQLPHPQNQERVRDSGPELDTLLSSVMHGLATPTSHSTTSELPELTPPTTVPAVHEMHRQTLVDKQPILSEQELIDRVINNKEHLQNSGRAKKFIHAVLPPGLVYDFSDRRGKDVRGVRAARVIGKGEAFGPYRGALLEEDAGKEIGTTWELCMQGCVWFYIDGRNKIHNNWLFNVTTACTREEQNMEAIQSYGEVYYRAVDTIQPGAELRVFYSDEYRERIGCRAKLEDLDYKRDLNSFQCAACNTTYHNSKSILRHIKFIHQQQSPSKPRSSMLPLKIRSMKVKQEMMAPQPQGKKNDENNKGAMETTDGSMETSASTEDSQLQDEENEDSDVVTAASLKAAQIAEENEGTRESGATGATEEGASFANEDNHFVCTTCGKHFPTKGRLIAHELFHEITCEKYTCDICGITCGTNYALMRHKVLHEDRGHKCSMCFRSYSKRDHLQRHALATHHLNLATGYYVCKGCGKKYERKEKLTRHWDKCKRLQMIKKMRYARKKKDEDSDEDEEDDSDDSDDSDEGTDDQQKQNENEHNVSASVPSEKRESGPRDMLGLRLTETAKLPYRCKYCRMRFQKTAARDRHQRKKHVNRTEFSCEHCPKSFLSRHRLITHMRSHSQDRRYKCPICPRSFGCESALAKHQVEHTDERPHKCDPCLKGFRTRALLQEHNRRMHAVREMRYDCSFCDKKFPDKTGLKRHERRHKGIRPFVCMICGKAFTSKYCLDRHQLVHTGEKPFKCHLCEKTFALNHHLDNHLLSHSLKNI